MPGWDGTGPLGHGPMTGRGCGYCVLRLPEDADDRMVGLAGKSGRPVEPMLTNRAELACLCRQARQFEASLGAIRDRMAQLHSHHTITMGIL